MTPTTVITPQPMAPYFSSLARRLKKLQFVLFFSQPKWPFFDHFFGSVCVTRTQRREPQKVLRTSGVHEGVLQAPCPQASKPPTLETASKQLQKITIFDEKTKVFYFLDSNTVNGERSEHHLDSI